MTPTDIATKIAYRHLDIGDGARAISAYGDACQRIARMALEPELAEAVRERENHHGRCQAAELDNERLRQALRIIAGLEQCADNLMGNADVARAALR